MCLRYPLPVLPYLTLAYLTLAYLSLPQLTLAYMRFSTQNGLNLCVADFKETCPVATCISVVSPMRFAYPTLAYLVLADLSLP